MKHFRNASKVFQKYFKSVSDTINNKTKKGDKNGGSTHLASGIFTL